LAGKIKEAGPLPSPSLKIIFLIPSCPSR